MGLASFNRMRMQQKEEMRPENIQKRQIGEVHEIKEKEVEPEMPTAKRRTSKRFEN